MKFDSFAIVDWSGGNDTGPRPRKDAIWLGLVQDGYELQPQYIRNRIEAEQVLSALIEQELNANRRLLIGFDFPFGFPAGFARELTGKDDPFAVWEWLEKHLEDAPKTNNRFDLAGQINALFPGIGPFWFNGLSREIDQLPRKDIRNGHGMPEKRAAEAMTKGAFTCWQMGGAGAVGGQVLTGLPILSRLRRAFSDQIAIWPFEPLTKPVAIVEIWPSLINPVVKDAEAKDELRDAAQVRLMARAVSCLSTTDMKAMLDVVAPEEGWIMGLGHEDKLIAAASELRPPPLRDDCFALPAGVDWTPVDEALAMLEQRLRCVVGQETVPLTDAQDRILAQDVIAKRSNPPNANTAVDGYGFAFDSLNKSAQTLPLVEGRAAAGAPFAETVPVGYAVRILTGSILPNGVDTVILQEDVNASATHIAFNSGIKRGANTREAGEDVKAGDLALQKGRRITPADLALCAATGSSELSVFETLRVAVLSTGDELVEPGTPTGDGQIYDANRSMLLSLIKRFGYSSVDLGIIRDDEAALKQALDQGAQQADLILTSGGASSGDEDHVSTLLNAKGAMTEWRVAMKPGRPLALAVWDGVPVFGLPGNPVAALACTLVFARPAMRALAGEGWQSPQAYNLPAGFSKSKKPGRREYLRARVRDGSVEVFHSEGSGRISGLSWAEGLVELPDGAVRIKPGDLVRYIPFGNF
ncbi:MAG: gephyrin-like molybdotransferase Glp [Pseudomonadota bacterium]